MRFSQGRALQTLKELHGSNFLPSRTTIAASRIQQYNSQHYEEMELGDFTLQGFVFYWSTRVVNLIIFDSLNIIQIHNNVMWD